MAAYDRCTAGRTVREACSGLVDDLHEVWDLPSVYLLIDGRLRCQASRGYFQVSDGFPETTGVIGRVVSTGLPEVVGDVTRDPSFVAAIPDLRAEACVPVRLHGTVVGAVNVESRKTLPDGTVEELTAAAAALGRRLEMLGGVPKPCLAERLGKVAMTLAGQTEPEAVARVAVAAAVELSGMSTAALALVHEASWSVQHADGPLAAVVRAWGHEELAVLGGWVRSGNSSYFPDGEDVPERFAFLGHGLHALAVQPLVVAGQVLGLLLVGDSRVADHDPEHTTVLELLAGQTAATLAMVRTLELLARQAYRDSLTGIANRRKLLEALDQATEGTLVLLDLDGFKSVNDLHGHAEGDAVLVAVAGRLVAAAAEDDLVCRLGGDEFAVLSPRATTPVAAAGLAAELVEAVSRYDEHWHPTVGASAGARVIERSTPSALLVDADAALYTAKHRGRGQSVVWDPSLRKAGHDLSVLADDLMTALAAGQLRLVYQPIVDTTTLEVIGVEALARWGLTGPSDFVAAAERTGVVDVLTRWVLRTACTQALAWPAHLRVGVNISGSQLTSDAIVRDVREALVATGLEPSRLVLEVTETSSVGELPRAKRTLERLSTLGVRLALDDFGTGHSSLTHAHALPFDILKIDQTFVALATAGDKRAIATVAAVLALGRTLDVNVVAEGVEDQAQLRMLRELGCVFAQGFALSRPLEARAVTALSGFHGTWRVASVPRARASRDAVAAH